MSPAYVCPNILWRTKTRKWVRITARRRVSHNCFYYTSKPECAIPDDNKKTKHSGSESIKAKS